MSTPLGTPQRLVAAARPALKTAVRRAGVATAPLRPLPDFLVIGAKRGGSTSFYYDLLEHPGVVRLFPPPLPGLKPDATKGVHYFDSNYPRGERWYRSYFPTRLARAAAGRRTGGPAVTGEASPYYLFHPDAARRAHALVPDARIVVVLRDPVERTYSHWKERRRGGAEPLDFEAALRAEPERLAGERERLLADPGAASYAWEQQSYAAQSEYAEALRPWIDRYGRDRLLVLFSEDYYRDPVAALAEADRFLGLEPRTTSTGQVRNAAAGAPLDPELRRRLTERFATTREQVAAIAGRTPPWSTAP